MKKIVPYSICLLLVCLLLLVSVGCNNPTSPVSENRSGVEVSKAASVQVDYNDYSWNNGWYLPKHAVVGQDYPFQWKGSIPGYAGGNMRVYYRKQGSEWNFLGSGGGGPYMSVYVNGTLNFPTAGLWEFGSSFENSPIEVSASITVLFSYTPPSCGSISTSSNPVYGNSFEVYANNVQNATRVVFPTWTDANGQDDLIWHEGVYDAANNRWKYTVDISQHKYEVGSYTTHVYLIGADGQSVCVGGLSTNVVYSWDDYSWNNGWFLPNHPVHGRTYQYKWTGTIPAGYVALLYYSFNYQNYNIGITGGMPGSKGTYGGTFNIPSTGVCSFEIRDNWNQSIGDIASIYVN